MLNKVSCLNVKHKAGHLSYAEDPNGYKSLIAQTLSTNDFNSWSVSVSFNLIISLFHPRNYLIILIKIIFSLRSYMDSLQTQKLFK